MNKKLVQLFQSLLMISLAFSSFASSLSPYSTPELDELEKEFVQQINQSPSIERHPLANQFINNIGKKLAKYAGIRTPYFFIVKSNEINAFAGPGGYIGINTQLILASHSESELAAVMAHELAHVRLHHLYRLIEHQKQMRIPMLATLLASAALGAVNPTLASGAMLATVGGFAQDNINFTRANEKEADRIGIDMLKKAGYNPHAMASFFKKMQESSRYYYTANIPAILRTHPLDSDRIAEAENRSMGFTGTTPNSLDYELFKELIRNSVTPEYRSLIDYYRHDCRSKSSETACHYGEALADLSSNHFSTAESKLQQLLNHEPSNIFYQIAMSEAEIGSHNYSAGINRLRDLQANYPENYAALMAYAHGLTIAGESNKATAILLKGSRLYKNDLPLCEELAQAYSASNQKAYAYFTEAQCQLLQGRQRDAIRNLKIAKNMATQDKYLYERARAKIDEIKFLLTD